MNAVRGATGAAASPVWSRMMVSTFVAFAFGYFLSTLVRAVPATLAPTLRSELGLSAGDLGLLSGAYFIGFSLTQLPLGAALDRHGPKRMLIGFLAVAALASFWFSQATSLTSLVIARAFIGVGVSACLMAPLTAYRFLLPADQQLRANAWMLMTGSLGMLASTLPVHWLLPIVGWRGLFVGLGVLVMLSMALIAWIVPNLPTTSAGATASPPAAAPAVAADASPPARSAGYGEIFRHPRFLQLLPPGLFIYGGMIAVQALWAGPWLTQVAGLDAGATARGLFLINLVMLFTFMAWGAAMPKLARRGITAPLLLRWGLALPLVMLAINLALGAKATAPMWALWCVASSVVTLTQPMVAQEFPPSVAGRALSAYNLVLFVGIFLVQWGVGVGIDALVAAGWDRSDAFRGSMGVFGVLCLLSYGWHLAWDRRLRRSTAG